MAVALVTSILAFLAGRSATEANRQRRQSESRLADQHAFGAFVDWDTDPVKSFLSAATAESVAPDDDPIRPAYETMAAIPAEAMPELVTNLETEVSAAAISPDLKRIAVKPAGARAAFVIPATGRFGKRVQLNEEPELGNYFKCSSAPMGR